jgi:hypothetical protein
MMLGVSCLLLAACAPPPKTATDVQVEKIVEEVREDGKKLDALEAEAAKLKGQAVQATQSAEATLATEQEKLKAACEKANAAMRKAWDAVSDDIK